MTTSKQSSTLETLSAMCRQEEHYQANDYLRSEAMPLHEEENYMLDIDEESRSKMAQWCYRVIEFCSFDRETVSIAMNVLDRFMSSSSPQAHAAKSDRRLYQLAAMTSLYSAIKIHEPEAIDPAMVCKISHGTYTVKEVEDMEAQILMGVSWRVNPPTPLAFVRQYLDLIPCDQLDDFGRDLIYNLAKVQTEATVPVYELMAVKPSVIAYAAFTNALTSLQVQASQSILITLTKAILHSLDNSGVTLVADVQNFLCELLMQQPVAQTILETCSKHDVVVKPSQMTTIVDSELTATTVDAKDFQSCSPRSVSTTAAVL